MAHDKYKNLIVITVLAVAILAVYWRVHEFEFINYDDDKYVSENTNILTGLTISNVIWAFTASHFFMWHPVTSLSHMLDCKLFGLNPGRHHIVNLLFHIANTILLFEIFRRMTNRTSASAFVAALFALHPLNVESVAWVAERKTVLSGFFWMLTIAAYIKYVKNPRTSNYLLIICVFSLALMSKPTAVTLPFVLLLLDYWPLDRLQWSIPSQSKSAAQFKKLSPLHLVKEKVPLFLLSAAVCIITFTSQKGGDVLQFNEQFPFNIRLANALVSYVTYIGKMFCPVRLSVFYPHPGLSLPPWKPVASFTLLIALSIAVFYFGRRKTYLSVGWLWFLGTLIPVIGLVQAGGQAMADRYSYIPLIGLFIIVAWGTNDLFGKWKYKHAVLGSSAFAVIAILAVLTWFQLGHWRNSLSLFDHALKTTSGNHVAHNNFALALNQRKKFDEAIDHLQRAMQINPYFLDAYSNLGMIYINLGRYPQAIEICLRAVKINPMDKSIASVYNNLGVAYGAAEQYQQAAQAFEQAVRHKPDFAAAHCGLGISYFQLGDRDSAIKEYEILKKIDMEKANTLLELINKQTNTK